MKTYNQQLGHQVFLATNEKLIEVKLLKETLTFTTATYEYEHNGDLYSAEVNLDSLRFNNLFYTSVENYQNRLPIEPQIQQFRFGRKEVGNTEDKLVVPAYVFENNRAVMQDVDVLSVINYTPYRYEVIIDDSVCAYKSVRECLAYNKIEVANISGEDIPTDTGYMIDVLAFSAEQKKAIEKLRKAIEEVNKTCTFLCNGDGLSVINGKHRISDGDWGEYYTDEVCLELYKYGIDLPAIHRNFDATPIIIK